MIPYADEPVAEVSSNKVWRRLAVWMEWCFAAAIVLAIFALIRDVLVDGYLPDPFLNSKSETFTDWYNPAYWAYNRGTYSEWSSIYPPFAFVFLRLFSNSECYRYSIDAARGCDPAGIVIETVLTFVNFGLAWRVFHKVDRTTALPRAIAVGLGFPAIYAWERGNLIVPCFTAYILAYGNLLKSARLKTLCVVISIHFKPYLILALAGRILKREWIWLEWCALWFVMVYAVSYVIFGAGDPITIFNNTLGFEHTPGVDLIGFTTTYTALLTILKLPLPLTEILGSSPIEMIESTIPILIYAGVASSLPCLAYAMFRPNICTRGQVSAFVLIIFMAISTSAGGYALHFALFFIMFESWRGPSRILVLVSTYLWCIPFDFPVVDILQEYGYSFLGQRNVQYELALTFGELVRPGLLLLIEYGLVWVFAANIFRDISGAVLSSKENQASISAGSTSRRVQ